MKMCIQNPLTLPVLVVVAGLVLAGRLAAQTLATLHSFTLLIPESYESSLVYTNSDGAYPWAGLILSGDTLYGTTSDGGNSGNGTVFAVQTDGTDFTTLHSF